MKNPERLIGKKIKGFEFQSTTVLAFSKTCSKYVDKVGIIELYDQTDNTFFVVFDDNEFYYPADQIEAHLVEEEIPTLSDGVMMLVGFNNTSWYKRKVIGQKNGVYYAWDGGIILKHKYAKPLEPTKEEQLIAILGSSDKVKEIMELFNDKKE